MDLIRRRGFLGSLAALLPAAGRLPAVPPDGGDPDVAPSSLMGAARELMAPYVARCPALEWDLDCKIGHPNLIYLVILNRHHRDDSPRYRLRDFPFAARGVPLGLGSNPAFRGRLDVKCRDWSHPDLAPYDGRIARVEVRDLHRTGFVTWEEVDRIIEVHRHIGGAAVISDFATEGGPPGSIALVTVTLKDGAEHLFFTHASR